MTRSAFFQPRRAKDVDQEEGPIPRQHLGHVAKLAGRQRPRRSATSGDSKKCDEGGCPGRVWSRRSATGVRSQTPRTETTEVSYRFGTPEPTVEVLEQQLQEVSDEEELLRAQLKELEHQLAQACGADGEDYSHRKSRFKHRVDDLTALAKQLRDQRVQILEGTDPEVQEEQRKREEIRKFKTAGGYTSEEQIDQRIAELEQRMFDVSMELMQEKRILSEMQSLQRQKEEVREHRRLEKTLRPDAEIIRSRLEDIGTQLKATLLALQEATGELTALEEERQSTLAQSPLVAERSRVHHRLNECVQLKTQLEGKVQGIHARERAKEEQRRIEEELRLQAEEEEARRRQEEEEQEERRSRQREERRKLREERIRQERRHDEAKAATATPVVPSVPELPKEPPGSAEMRLLQQVLLYCTKLLPKSNDSVEKKKPIEYNNPEGSLIIVPPEERSEEYLFAPPKPRRHEGKVRKRPPTSKLKKNKDSQQVLLHSPWSLKLFDELKMVPPVNTSDVPVTIEEVEQRLAELCSAAQRWEVKRQELLEQRLQNELEKVREAQEERENERHRRLKMALLWLQDFEDQALQNEDGHGDLRSLEDLLSAARSMGASDSQLSSALRLQRAWRAAAAQAALKEAVEAGKELLEFSEAESQSFREASKDLEGAIRKAKEADVDPQQLQEAEELLKALDPVETREGGGPAEEDNEDDKEPALESEPGAGPASDSAAQDVEEFVPTILNLDDDEEELVFDLGM